MLGRLRQTLRRRFGPTAPGRAITRFQRRQMRDSAATITYYGMLSLFPALLFAVSLLGLLGGIDLVDKAVALADDAGLGAEAQTVIGDAVETAVNGSESALGIAMLIGLLLALSGASGVLNAVGRALDELFDAETGDGPGFLRRRATSVALTAVLLALAIVGLTALFLGGDLAHDAFDGIGLGQQAENVWAMARWPLAALAAALSVSAVFRWTPSPAARRSRVLTPGALTVIALWLIVSTAFGFYLRNFGNYGAVYGAFSGAVVLLLWLNLLATAFLFGAALDAEIERPPADPDASSSEGR